MGFADPRIRRSVHPTSVLEVTKTEVDDRGGAELSHWPVLFTIGLTAPVNEAALVQFVARGSAGSAAIAMQRFVPLARRRIKIESLQYQK